MAHWDRATGLAVANTVAVEVSMEHATTNITMTNCIFGTSVTVILCFFSKACGRLVYYCLEEPVQVGMAWSASHMTGSLELQATTRKLWAAAAAAAAARASN